MCLGKLSSIACGILFFIINVNAQVYSPWVLTEKQPDTRDLVRTVETLYENAGAETDREKAEAIWRYLLTDGRFAEPGVFYHIAGWAYEEPMGEVLDPIKLLNSYGFGLCYQVAPLLEGLWEAGGFPDARSWFLTGHTVAEVYFDGKYNMLDSDMLGYTTIGEGDPYSCPIASVRQLEDDERIILGKMLAADKADISKVIDPWYPADVREKAMEGYAGLFTSREDNWLFYFKRFPAGHSMDFVLRPGEKMIRYFEPETEALFYLPYKRAGQGLSEFPREVERWKIKTENGPHSQKDSRLWATGRIEYSPSLAQGDSYYPLFNENLRLPANATEPLRRENEALPAVAVFEMATPYVLINADFEVKAVLATPAHHLTMATSIDGARSWQPAGSLVGPFNGSWRVGPEVLVTSKHGVATAVSGKYGYLVRMTMGGPASGEVSVSDVKLTSFIQVNPRTLPGLKAGENKLSFVPGSQWKRWNLPVDLSRIGEFAMRQEAIEYSEENSNGMLVPCERGEGELILEVSAPGSSDLFGFYAGGRFLVLNDLGPEKLTAETRATSLRQKSRDAAGSLSWSLKPTGPWEPIWEFTPPSKWLDSEPVERLLLWPEVDHEIHGLPAHTERVYLRYALKEMALDDIRVAALSKGTSVPSVVKITHNWYFRGSRMSHSVEIPNPDDLFEYVVQADPFGEPENLSIVFECPAVEQ